MTKIHLAYFGGFILLSIIGSYVQLKYTCKLQAQTDEIEGADPHRKSMFDKHIPDQEEGGEVEDDFVRFD
jgi:hypothetical protein